MYSGARKPSGFPSTKQKSQWFPQRLIRGGSSVTPIGSPSGRSMSYSTASPRRQARRQEEAVVRREELPVEEVLERPAIDGQQLGSRREPQLAADGVGRYRLHANHGTSLPFKDFVRPDVATPTRAVTSKSYQICFGKRDRASRRSLLAVLAEEAGVSSRRRSRRRRRGGCSGRTGCPRVP